MCLGLFSLSLFVVMHFAFCTIFLSGMLGWNLKWVFSFMLFLCLCLFGAVQRLISLVFLVWSGSHDIISACRALVSFFSRADAAKIRNTRCFRRWQINRLIHTLQTSTTTPETGEGGRRMLETREIETWERENSLRGWNEICLSSSVRDFDVV